MPNNNDRVTRDNFRFLIIGAGRGGTSLLAGLLDSHSQLEVGFELFAIRHLMGKSRFPALFRKRRTLLQDRILAFKEACREEASKFPDKLWGNKITTEQIYGLYDHNTLNPGQEIDVVDYFFRKGLPDVKIVFILRDGRACIRSKVKRTGQSYELACERWKFSVLIHQYLMQSPDNSLIIRFEDLVTEPAPVLERICGFLGVPFEPEMLAGTRNDKMIPEYRSATLDRSKVISTDIPEKYLSLIEDELRLCKYL